jgi:phage tail sheath protein FI
MPIFQQGSLNASALVLPNLYVQIVPPQNLIINGVPTNIIGCVGSASWGPVNQPVIVATSTDYVISFGQIIARKHDLGTQVYTAVQQGASSFVCVRVTDGTDTAASYAVGSAGGVYAILLSAMYSGSTGNGVTISLSASSQLGAWRLTVSLPGVVPEVFDGILGATPQSIWQNLVAAVNSGNGPLRGPSQIIVASLGSAISSGPITFGPQFLLGGSDGAAMLTTGNILGQDIQPRSGMYALRNKGCSLGVLADLDDPTSWSAQTALGVSEGIYMILTGPSGDTISNATNVVQQAGIDSCWTKLMFGDWIYWNDPTNQLLRLVSPQGFVAGRLSNLSPEQSGLNKPIYSVVGTQKSGTPGSGQNATYSDAELTQLIESGIDGISNPQPGGSFWGMRSGHNTSTNPTIWSDSYSRMTNYVSATLSAGMGQYVGQVINRNLFQNIRATLLSFLQNLLSQGVLGSLNGSLPYSVICDSSNNPISQTSLGYVRSDVQIHYQGINEKFVVNIEGGQSVVVNQQISP